MGRPLQIAPFQNPGGSIAWRVSGTVSGLRIRRNFPSREAAERWADQVEAGSVPGARRLEARATWLSEAQIREAELAFGVVTEGDLLGLARRYAEQHRAVRSVPIAAALREYLEDRRRSGVRPATLCVTRYTLEQWARGLWVGNTGDLHASHATDWVYSEAVAGRTRKDRRQRLGQFLAWAVRAGYLATNPLEDAPAIRTDPAPPRILDVAQARDLLSSARAHRDGLMLPYFAVCLFAGLRPHEARRLAPEDFHLRARPPVIEISARIAKVRQCRQVELAPNLRAILRAQHGAPCVRWNARAFNEVRETAGLMDAWQNDILRHTYASYWYGMHQDVRRLAYLAGNSPQVLFRHYIRPVRAPDGKAFFSLR